MVWSLMWSSEVFSVLSLRTRASIKHFPRIFLLYFSFFHFYFFSRPFGFSYLSLLTTWLFLLHSMIHFYYNYEIPALQRGVISNENLRSGFHQSMVQQDLQLGIDRSSIRRVIGVSTVESEERVISFRGLYTPERPARRQATSYSQQSSPGPLRVAADQEGGDEGGSGGERRQGFYMNDNNNSIPMLGLVGAGDN